MASDQDHASRHASTVPLNVPGWCARFIGVPYKDDGHDFRGCNCWGLVHLVLKHRAGIEVDPFADVSAADIAEAIELTRKVAASSTWLPVSGSPREFDVALLSGRPLHTGIVVASDLLLHVWRSPASMVMRLDNMRIRARMVGFYRHSGLA